MGSPCCPSVANTYLSYFEIKYKHMIKVSLYYRFIDDVFYSDTNEELTKYFPTIYPNLKLNYVTGDIVQFLDCNISKNSNNTLNYDLFVKPTFTGSYLHIDSNHVPHTFRGIIISLINRIRRTCSDLNKYYYHSSQSLSYLLLKGYSPNLILNMIRSFSNIKRDSLIKYKERKNSYSENSLFFVTIFDNHISNSSTFFRQIWDKNVPDNSFLKNYLLKTLYKNSPNFNSYFISRFYIPFSNYSYIKCNSDKCKICNYAITDNFLHNFDNIPIAIPSKVNCHSENIIYFLYCTKCNKIYIGESKRTAQKRINEHIQNIKFLIKYKSNIDKINKKIENSGDSIHLYNHFALNHSLDDFRFQIFISNINNYRLRLETDLIYIFNSIYPHGLNSKTSFRLESFEPYKKL